MRKSITKKSKLTYAELKKKLWRDYFSPFIRQRDRGICVTCNKRGSWKYDMEAGHYVPGSVCGIVLYFDERNINSQCTGCNKFRHGNRHMYALYLQRKYGKGILEELEKVRRETYGERWSRSKLEEKIEEYKKKLQELTHES